MYAYMYVHIHIGVYTAPYASTPDGSPFIHSRAFSVDPWDSEIRVLLGSALPCEILSWGSYEAQPHGAQYPLIREDALDDMRDP